MRFDYERAWKELAKPGFDSIIENSDVKELLDTITEHCKELRQDAKTLDLPWPEGLKEKFLRERFERIDTPTLALASFMVYNYGHWMPSNQTEHRSLETWRFSNFADQILRKRLKIEREIGVYSLALGYSFVVDHGLLVLCRRTLNDSCRSPVAFAVPEARDVAQGVVNLARITNEPDFDAVCNRCVQEAAPKEGLGARCFRLGDYTISDELYEHIRACRKAEAEGKPAPAMPRPKTDEGLVELYRQDCAVRRAFFTVDRVTHINYRLKPGVEPFKNCPPYHPFVIGRTHIVKSNDILDPTVAPCDACGRDFSQHISDRVAVLKLLRSVNKSEAMPILDAFVQEIKGDGVDGVVFLDTPEKYRITDDPPKLTLVDGEGAD